MKTLDLIEKLAVQLRITKALASEMVEVFTHEVMSTAQNGRVHVAGMGIFMRTKRKARRVLNPKTGEPMQLPAMKSIRFRPAKRWVVSK